MNITDKELETVVDIMERSWKNNRYEFIAEIAKRKWKKKFPFIWNTNFKYIWETNFSINNISYHDFLPEDQLTNLHLNNGLSDIFIMQIWDWCWAYNFCSDEIYCEVSKKIREFETTIDFDYKDIYNHKYYFHSDKAEENIKKLNDFLVKLREEIPEMYREKKIEKLKKELETLTN